MSLLRSFAASNRSDGRSPSPEARERDRPTDSNLDGSYPLMDAVPSRHLQLLVMATGAIKPCFLLDSDRLAGDGLTRLRAYTESRDTVTGPRRRIDDEIPYPPNRSWPEFADSWPGEFVEIFLRDVDRISDLPGANPDLHDVDRLRVPIVRARRRPSES